MQPAPICDPPSADTQKDATGSGSTPHEPRRAMIGPEVEPMSPPVEETVRRFTGAIERCLRAVGDPERAAGAKRYLKSEMEFLGVKAPELRRCLAESLSQAHPLDRPTLVAVATSLWQRGPFELKAAAAELLATNVGLLQADDLSFVEGLLRESRTWALVDALAPRVAGPMVERFAKLESRLDAWAADDDVWMRRAALLADLLPLRRGQGSFARFARYADSMLDDREVFIRKAIGWVLRETGKRRPELVAGWLRPRLARVSGLTLREAVKYLPEAERRSLRGSKAKGR